MLIARFRDPFEWAPFVPLSLSRSVSCAFTLVHCHYAAFWCLPRPSSIHLEHRKKLGWSNSGERSIILHSFLAMSLPTTFCLSNSCCCVCCSCCCAPNKRKTIFMRACEKSKENIAINTPPSRVQCLFVR